VETASIRRSIEIICRRRSILSGGMSVNTSRD